MNKLGPRSPNSATSRRHASDSEVPEHPSATVGIIGVGTIGRIMAKHILASGRELIVWDRRPEAIEHVVKAGARPASKLADLRAASTVLSIVFDDKDIENIAFSPGGLVDSLAPGSLHLVFSTISPQLSRHLHDRHAAKGQRYLAASMFGRPEAAALAQTLFTCSGSADAYQDAAPILSVLGTPKWIGSEPEHAMLVKIMGNNMIHAAVETLCEMFEFLAAGGIGMQEAKESIVDRLFPGLIYQGYAERLLAHGVQPRAFHPMREKDSRLCMNAARALHVELPLFKFLRELHSPDTGGNQSAKADD